MFFFQFSFRIYAEIQNSIYFPSEERCKRSKGKQKPVTFRPHFSVAGEVMFHRVAVERAIPRAVNQTQSSENKERKARWSVQSTAPDVEMKRGRIIEPQRLDSGRQHGAAAWKLERAATDRLATRSET